MGVWRVQENLWSTLFTLPYIIQFSEKYVNAIRCNHSTDAKSMELQMFMADYYIVSQKIGMKKIFCYL